MPLMEGVKERVIDFCLVDLPHSDKDNLVGILHKTLPSAHKHAIEHLEFSKMAFPSRWRKITHQTSAEERCITMYTERSYFNL